MSELINRVNWVDVIVLILLLKISYTSSQIGVGKQILPSVLLLVIFTVTFYYYRDIASFFIKRYFFNPTTCKFFTYSFMMLLFLVIYHFVSRITGFFLFPSEASPALIEKIGGAFLGVFQSTLIIGMIMVGLLLAPIEYIEASVKTSYSGLFFPRTILKLYVSIANSVLKNKNITYNKELELLFEEKSYMFESIKVEKKEGFFKFFKGPEL